MAVVFKAWSRHTYASLGHFHEIHKGKLFYQDMICFPLTLSCEYTKYKRFINLVLDYTLQLIVKEITPVEFWNSSKEEHPQLSNLTRKILFPFPTIYLCGTRLFSYTKQNNTLYQIDCGNRYEDPTLFF